MKRKAFMILAALMIAVSVFAGSSGRPKDPKGWGILDDQASANVGIQIKPEDVSYHLIGFTAESALFFPQEPEPLKDIELVLTKDKTAATDDPDVPMYIYYYIIAPKQPKLTLIAGDGLERDDTQTKIAYDITVENVPGKASSGNPTGLEIPLQNTTSTGFAVGGASQFHIKTTTPITVDMASKDYKWHDTITLKLTSAD